MSSKSSFTPTVVLDDSTSMQAKDPEQADLVGALVEANDRLVSLVSLATLPNADTDWHSQVSAIAREAHLALQTLGVRLRTSDGTWIEAGRCGQATDDSYLSVELGDGDEQIMVEAWRSHLRFTSADRRFLEAVVHLAATVIRMGALREERTTTRDIAADHAAAVRIARSLMPSSRQRSAIDGVSLYGSSQPVRTAGGDFYTWVETDNRVFFAVGDVSGKGLAAAVLMTTVMNALEHAMRRDPDGTASAIFESTSRQVYTHLSEAGMFVTLVVGSCCPETGEVEVINAGHSPVIFASGGVARPIEATVPPVGVVDNPKPEAWHRLLSPGDLLVFGSDGLTEQEDWRGKPFGDDAFAAAVANIAPQIDAPEAAGELFRLVDAYTGPAPQSDDRTLLVLRVNQGLASAEPPGDDADAPR